VAKKINRYYNEKTMEWFNTVLEGVIILDENMVVMYANPSFLEYAKLKKEQIIGQYFPKARPGAVSPRAYKEKKPLYNIHRTIPNGVESYVDILPTIEEGEVIGALILVRDIRVLNALFARIQEKDTQIKQLGQRLREIYRVGTTFQDVIGAGESFFEEARKAAGTECSVLLTGESGTGKEVIAQAIHNESQRRRQPFVDINCAALPESLFESELFGYAPGAFTGASRNGKIGLFELANGGTLFLDEITEMPLAMQSKLLRVLQEQTIRRLGDNKNIPLDVRVIAATNRDILHAVETGVFREDLYYRLAVAVIQIPPLRERKEAIAQLVAYFIELYRRKNKKEIHINREAERILRSCGWPGNVRQLKNAIEYSCAFSANGEITIETLPHYVFDCPQAQPAGPVEVKRNPRETLPQLLDRMEAEVLAEALREYGDGLTAKEQIAKELGISIATLYNKLRKHSLNF
jgi:transcriptional regulator with PAS, ATPase and Fis domain